MEKVNETNNGQHLKKVVIIGPESTGKSTLTASLAKHYNTAYVPEFARHYIDRLDRPYEESDFPEIAKGQLDSEAQMEKQANGILFIDTCLIVLKVWSEHKFGACYPEIIDKINQQQYDLYLLTGTDVPWEEDPQREHPHLRDFFYNVYRKELQTRNLPFIEIQGEYYYRKKAAVKAVDDLLSLA